MPIYIEVIDTERGPLVTITGPVPGDIISEGYVDAGTQAEITIQDDQLVEFRLGSLE